MDLAGVERQLQVHTAGGATKFHGHGGAAQDDKPELLDFFRRIDKGVRDILREDRAPLVLAGVDYLFPLYREANTHPFLVAGGVAGNPEGKRPEDLLAGAWAVVEPVFRQARKEAAERHQEFQGSAKASDDIRAVVPAACSGRVDQLFVAVGKQVWGQWDEPNHQVSVSAEKQPGDRDLLNLAAVQTYLNGGAVYAVTPEEVPGNNLLAAVFRY